ncbi:MAG: family 16 glycoside hydrolase [Planctomycetota bacterium]
MVASLALALACALTQSPAPQTSAPAGQPAPIRTWVVSGANNHDWEWTSPEIARVLTETGRFDVRIVNEPAKDLAAAATAVQAGELQLLVLNYNGPRWGEAAEAAFVAAVEAGCGVTVIHAANNAFKGWAEYERMVGLLWRDGTGHGAYHPFDIELVVKDHPITLGMAPLRQHPDELYHKLVKGAGAEFTVLLDAFDDPKTGGSGQREPMATVASFGKGRVFHTPLGHTWKGVVQSRASWHDPQLRRLVARGSEWAATGAVTLAPEPLNFLGDAERSEGFQLLFNGHKVDAWRAYKGDAMPAQGWTVRDAAIVHEAGGGGGDLVSVDEYGDFDFRFAFRVASKANSGVMWHVTEDQEQTYMSGPEFQVLDDLTVRPGKKHGVGALYDLVPPKNPPLRPAGQWNDGRIVVHEGRIRFWLNGAPVVDVPGEGAEWDTLVAASKFKDWPFGKARRGRLALQDHGDEVAFRNLRIRSL